MNYLGSMCDRLCKFEVQRMHSAQSTVTMYSCLLHTHYSYYTQCYTELHSAVTYSITLLHSCNLSAVNEPDSDNNHVSLRYTTIIMTAAIKT